MFILAQVRNANSQLLATFITVPPRTPFPVIEECQNKATGQTIGDNCSLVTPSALNITCSVFEFFPDITLYFRNAGWMKVETLVSREVTSSDGTKNKSVTITADPSTELYVCVASDIPGSSDQERETSILLYAPSPSSTSTFITMSTEKNDESGSPQIIGQ